MARRSEESNETARLMAEQASALGNCSLPIDQRLTALMRLRASGPEHAAEADRILLHQGAQQYELVLEAQSQQEELRGLIGRLTAPPYLPAVFLAPSNAIRAQGALVQTDTDRRVVSLGEGVSLDQLKSGDEVFLSHERNCLVAKSEGQSFLTGEIAAYSHGVGDNRLVLRARDEELVVLPTTLLRNTTLKTGDGVRYNRSTGVAFERIEASKGEEYFLEETPGDSFEEIGGLDKEIEILKRTLSMHLFHQTTTSKYKLRRKKAVLMEGPPGNGKTKVARATCAWLASLSGSGRARFINVKPGSLNSMWYGATEQRYREIFRIARDAATANPDQPVVMFWDEVDAVGGNRGESIQRIDDRMLNAFMAELNGLEERGNIVVLSATNRRDALDPALVRPGRLGDLVLHFPQPNRKAARAILGCHLPSEIPYAANGEGPSAAREHLLDLAVGQIFAQNADTEVANLTLRDGKRRLVRAADLVSGAHLEAIAQAAIERACIREWESGPEGVNGGDIDAAVSDFFRITRVLTPRNARNYLRDLPQDVDVVRVDFIEHKVAHPHRYRAEAA